MVRELLHGEYIDNRENVLLIGNSGTGKTHLASALGFAACAIGKKVRFFTVTNLVTELLEKREDRLCLRRGLMGIIGERVVFADIKTSILCPFKLLMAFCLRYAP